MLRALKGGRRYVGRLGLAALADRVQAQRFQEIPAVDVSVDFFVDVHSPTWLSMNKSIRTLSQSLGTRRAGKPPRLIGLQRSIVRRSSTFS